MSRVSVNKLANRLRTKEINVDTIVDKLASNLMPSATVPTTRADGSALVIGDSYFNTANDAVMEFTSTGWAKTITAKDIIDSLTSTDASKVLSAKMGKALADQLALNNVVITRYIYNASAGQTTITGNDINGKALAYIPGNVMLVEQNGTAIYPTSGYTATTGTSIVLTSPLGSASKVSITVFGTFQVANTYTKAEIEALVRTNGMYIGMPIAWKLPEATIPAGTILNNGQLLNRADWPDLWAKVSSSAIDDATWLAAPYTSRGMFSTGNGTTTFRMPDDNAKHADGNTIGATVLRGYGKNSAGTVGMHQQDQLQNITASMLASSAALINTSDVTGAMAANTTSVGARPSPTAAAGYTWTFDASRVARAGNETRMTNTTVIWLTVGANNATNVGSVDVTALATSVSTQSSLISDIQSKQVFTKKWTSSALTPAASSETILTHNLGDHFKLAKIYAVATGVTGIGVAVGERVDLGIYTTIASTSTSYGCQLSKSTTTTVVFTVANLGLLFTRQDTKAPWALSNNPSVFNIFVELYV